MMTRRNLIAGVTASAFAASTSQGAEGRGTNVYLEMKHYQLHNSPEEQSNRLIDHLRDSYAPAVGRAGGKLVGAFTNHIGMEAPYLLALTQYDGLAAFQTALDKLEGDTDYQHSLATLNSGQGYPYLRVKSSLLKTFNGMPQPLLTDASDKHPGRFFELRRYESPTEVTLTQKVRMFNGGEIGVFQRLGMRPVFFGETLVGDHMPNLVYMLSFDDLTAREQLWKQFAGDPEWKKLSAPPELHDEKIVSNISNAILRPLGFSPIR